MAKPDQTDTARISRLWRDYIWPQKGRFFTALGFMALYAAATAAFIYVITLVIDAAGTLGNDTQDALGTAQKYAWIVLPFLIGVPLLSGISGYIQRILTNSIALRSVGKMQNQMFASTHRRDYAQFSREPIGNLISKFTNDVTVVSNALVRILGNLFKDLLTIVFTIGVMLWTNWQLSLAMVVFGLAFWPIIEISKRLRGNSHDVQNHIGRITSELKDSFSGARMVKTYGLETAESKRLNYSFDERIRLYLKLVTQQARIDPILEVLGGVVIACVVIFGVYLFAKGQATGGQIA
ncbi:MAG: ABC transporter transmembrane domain-containing protein, partial [Litorimonas sp.]